MTNLNVSIQESKSENPNFNLGLEAAIVFKNETTLVVMTKTIDLPSYESEFWADESSSMVIYSCYDEDINDIFTATDFVVNAEINGVSSIIFTK